MVHAWQLMVHGARNIFGQVPPRRNRDHRITRAMKNQRRYPERVQQVTNIDLVGRLASEQE